MHDTLDLMVGFGVLMGLYWLYVVVQYFRKKDPLSHRFTLLGGIAVAIMGVFTIKVESSFEPVMPKYMISENHGYASVVYST